MSYSNNPSNSYINKKRREEETSNKNYRHDRYDKYEKNNMGYSSYNKNHSMISNNSYYHNSTSRPKNPYYPNPKNYHNYMKNDMRRDYKKSYQKYSNNDSEGIRNLSHYEMPSPKKNEEKKIKNNDNEGLIKNINQLVSNIVKFPNQKVPYQHIFQSQQNINIEINVTSPPDIKMKGEKEIIKEEKSKSKNVKEEKKNILNIPRPSPKLNIQKFNRNSIIIKENPIFSFDAFPDCLFNFKSSNQNIQENDDKDFNIKLESSYLLSKIPNWRLVSNFVSPSLLNEEKFENIPINNNKKEKKSYILYDSKYEYILEKNLIVGRKNKLLNDIYGIQYSIDKSNIDILKIKNKIKQKEFKLKCLSLKKESIDNAINDNRKED